MMTMMFVVFLFQCLVMFGVSSLIKKDKMAKTSTRMWHPLNTATCEWNGRVKGSFSDS